MLLICFFLLLLCSYPADREWGIVLLVFVWFYCERLIMIVNMLLVQFIDSPFCFGCFISLIGFISLFGFISSIGFIGLNGLNGFIGLISSIGSSCLIQ